MTAASSARALNECGSILEPAVRPKCCAHAAQTRWTREGGDCCKTPMLVEREDVLLDTPPADVAAAPSVRLPARLAVIAPPLETRLGFAARLERPPQRPPPTDTVVLLI